MHLPERMLIHKADLYARTVSGRDTSGGQIEHFPTTPTIVGIACCMQNAYSALFDEYLQLDDKQRCNMFLLDKAAFDAVTTSDRIVFNGENYRVDSKQNLVFRDLVYMLALTKEIK